MSAVVLGVMIGIADALGLLLTIEIVSSMRVPGRLVAAGALEIGRLALIVATVLGLSQSSTTWLSLVGAALVASCAGKVAVVYMISGRLGRKSNA